MPIQTPYRLALTGKSEITRTIDYRTAEELEDAVRSYLKDHPDKQKASSGLKNRFGGYSIIIIDKYAD